MAQPVVEQPAEAFPVGTHIFCAFLGMEATVIEVTTLRIRMEWDEPSAKGSPIRRGWLFRENCVAVEIKTAPR